MKRLSWRLIILAVALAACAGSASAQTTNWGHTTNCSGTLAPGTYTDVIVPANAECVLPFRGTVTVTGNVKVESGASLLLPPIGIVTVTGNVKLESGASLGVPGEFAETFIVHGSLLGVDANRISINGLHPENVIIFGSVDLRGTTGQVVLGGMSIHGTLFITYSRGDLPFELFANVVGGNVVVLDNTTSSVCGQSSCFVIQGNAIGGSLVCKGNTPAPTSPPDLLNTVGGNKVEQCASL